MRKNGITQEKIDRIKFHLRFMGHQRVADLLGVSLFTVSNVAKGNYDTGKLVIDNSARQEKEKNRYV